MLNNRNAALAFVFVTVLLDILSLGLGLKAPSAAWFAGAALLATASLIARFVTRPGEHREVRSTSSRHENRRSERRGT